MLSNQSERKVQSLLSAMEEEMVESIRPQLIEIKDTFQQAYDTEGKEEQGRHSQCCSVPFSSPFENGFLEPVWRWW